MDLATILADAQIVVTLGKLAIQLEQDAAPYLVRAYDILVLNKTLTDQERADMKAQEIQWRAEIDAAIAKDDGTTPPT